MMRRRDFLRATLITAGSVVAPAACSDDPDVSASCTVAPGDALFPQSVASGDPRPDSVVLWTRLLDPTAEGDVYVTLSLALDEAFTQRVTFPDGARQAMVQALVVQALKDNDHCVKVKVTGLEPGTTYYYQFFYARKDSCYGSRIGRTRTAPAPDKDVNVRFAFVSCQDYIGRYFNAYAALAQQENLDFFVHLGDYVYETTGDPRFQATLDARTITFTDTAGALELAAAGESYFAAKSLSNYRELYQQYRSDPALQRVHELFPMIAVWDDHEFSDDCHGATASYFNGHQDETDVPRRKAANRAWFEYMPVDYPDEDFKYDPDAEYPKDITIYRDFQFGQHVHLVMTDLRTYRADHLIPEGAFPGQVVATQLELDMAFGTVPEFASPYCEIETQIGGMTPETQKEGFYKDLLVTAAPSFGYDPKSVTGLISATFINAMVERINASTTPSMPPVPLIEASALASMDRGFAYLDLGKNGFYTSIGSRYLVVKDTFDPVSQLKYTASSGASGEVMGEEQQKWFLEKMEQSTSTWKVWGNEYCLTPLAIDLRALGFLPPQFQRRFYMNCDTWDGFRNRRNALIERLSALGNVVAITGDIHAFYAATPMANTDPTQKIVEFVSSSISTRPFRSLLISQIAGDPALSALPAASALAENIDGFLTGEMSSNVNPHLAYNNSVDNGFCVAEVSATEFVVSMLQLPEAELEKSQYDQPDAILGKLKISRFKTKAGQSELFREEADKTWTRWDSTTVSWVSEAS